MSANRVDEASTGNPFPPEFSIIEVSVPELKALFNSIDPYPFHEKDLDPGAADFIVSWAKELPRNVPLALLVHPGRSTGRPDEAVVLADGIHSFFAQRALAYRRRLRMLFRIGRTSLVIGLCFLGASIGVVDLLASRFAESRLAVLIRESVLIGGWVAMWRPLEIFLYDWWPILAEARLSDRLAAMPVQIRYEPHSASESWRHDRPAENP